LNSRGYVLLLAMTLLPLVEFYLFLVSIPHGQGQSIEAAGRSTKGCCFT
jgi:hypothetical protein